MRASLRIALIAFVLAAVPVCAHAVTLSDSTFLNGNWSATEVLDTSGSATFVAGQQLVGGNPNEFRQTTHNVPGGGQSIIVDHVFLAGLYSPTASGAVSSIDFSLDARFISGTTGTSQVGYQLVLQQNGSDYFNLSTSSVAQGPGNGAAGPWQSFAYTGLTAASFSKLTGGGPATPDFSATASDMSFGYLTQNTSISIDIQTVSGIDNWSVTVHPIPTSSVPEPATTVLLLAGAVGLTAARRLTFRSRAR